MTERSTRPDVHLRVLVPDDASWVAATDRDSATSLAPALGLVEDDLRRTLEAGEWASDERLGWAIIVGGTTSGFALVDGHERHDAEVNVRIGPKARGRGVGREVLRQLADHHFSADPNLARLTGRAHEANVPMQRAFNAAGFLLEARYREVMVPQDGRPVTEWGYALTRRDWEAGRHRDGASTYDLHGLVFELEETTDGPNHDGLTVSYHQEGRRVLARYQADELFEGESGGVLTEDVLRYRFVHLREAEPAPAEVLGRGRARLQRREDGRLEVVDRWSDERGEHGQRVLVQRG